MKKLMMVLMMGLALCSVGFAHDRDDFDHWGRNRDVREYRAHRHAERRERRRERRREHRREYRRHWRR